MNDFLEILNTTPQDLEKIHKFFEESIRYQIERGYPDWKNYDRNAIANDMVNKLQYKIIINDQIAMAFSVCYTDKIIWRERECGDAIYLHRVVVNPAFKGQKLFGRILAWSKEHCLARGLKKIRMDTWAQNANIIAYYLQFGFRIVENFETPDTEDLPIHNRRLALTLLEYNV